jgi:hypothetical protein
MIVKATLTCGFFHACISYLKSKPKIMRKKLLILCLTTFTLTGFSQTITKGSTFFGGSVGAGAFKAEDNRNVSPPFNQTDKNSGWNVQLQVGKAIRDNKILGVFIGYSRSKDEMITQNSSGNRTVRMEYNGGIFYRSYYSLGKRFYLFGDGSLGLALSKRETNNFTSNVSTIQGRQRETSVGLRLTPGLSFAASKALFLEASLNNLLAVFYTSGKSESFDQQGSIFNTRTITSFGVSANSNGFSSLSIGLRWIIPRGKA